MDRCKRCSAPVANGVEYCPPRRWIERRAYQHNTTDTVEFNGCVTARPPIYSAAPTPIKPNSVQLAGQIPIWMQLDDMGFYSNMRCYKHAAGSAWTHEHYGFGWSRFSRELRRITTALHIVLVGYHVPTLAAADVVEGVLLGERHPS